MRAKRTQGRGAVRKILEMAKPRPRRRRACAKLVREGSCTDPVIKAQRNALSAVFQLSMRLRVSPQARQVRKSLGSNTRPPTVNYYDRLQLEMGTDEEA
jgi:hypothetical protein